MTINISLIMTPYRSPHHDTLSFNRHSERCQECLVGKTGNGIVTQSNNSITPVTFYRKYRFYRMQGSPGI